MSPDRREPVIPDIDYYDCSEKPDGMYRHPFDCTRFIVCDNGRAHDRACESCDPADARSAGKEFMVFDLDNERCGWPAETECVTDTVAFEAMDAENRRLRDARR